MGRPRPTPGWKMAVNPTNAINSTASTNGNFVLSPVSLASWDQDGGTPNSTIEIYDLT